MSFFEILRVVKVMVGVVHPELGKRVARILVAIRQSTIYPPPLPQSYMVHTILVVALLHFSNWVVFLRRKCWDTMWNNFVLSMRYGHVLMVVHCFQIYKEVLYRFIRSRSLLRCCNGCLARGGDFLPKMGIIYVDVNCGTQDERMVCFEHCTLLYNISTTYD